MSESYAWCKGCNKSHESRETCPKGWIRHIFRGGYISPEENEAIAKDPDYAPRIHGVKYS